MGGMVGCGAGKFRSYLYLIALDSKEFETGSLYRALIAA